MENKKSKIVYRSKCAFKFDVILKKSSMKVRKIFSISAVEKLILSFLKLNLFNIPIFVFQWILIILKIG